MAPLPRFFLLAFVPVLGCAAAVEPRQIPYQPATLDNYIWIGYREKPLPSGGWKVQVDGYLTTAKEQLREHLLRRATELCAPSRPEMTEITDMDILDMSNYQKKGISVEAVVHCSEMPNQPLHPTTQAAEPPSSPGERRR